MSGAYETQLRSSVAGIMGPSLSNVSRTITIAMALSLWRPYARATTFSLPFINHTTRFTGLRVPPDSSPLAFK